jgi:Secretion system C-terminal sorting domain
MKSRYLWVLMLFYGILSAQNTVQVTFNFDATPLISNCWIAPTNGGKLALSGSFNGWERTEAVDAFTANGNAYSITKTLDKKTVGDTTYSYKLTAYPFTGGFLAWEADPNRSLVISANSGNQTVNLGAWQGDITNQCKATANVEVTFKVNVAAYRLSGDFNETTDQLVVAGNFNGWNAGAAGADTLKQSLLNADEFSKTRLFPNLILDTPQLSFKYVIRRPTTGEPIITWEGGQEKSITVPTTNPAPNPYTFTTSSCFNNLCADKVFPMAQTCYLELDARPAFYRLTDIGNLPSNFYNGLAGITQITGFFVNGPLAKQSESWKTWGDMPGTLGQSEENRLLDDGLNGDLVAGDSVYTKRFDFRAGEFRQYVGKFSANGFDNETGDRHDDVVVYPISNNCRVKGAFGAWGPERYGRYLDDVISSSIGNMVGPYDSYIDITHQVIQGATSAPFFTSNVKVVRGGAIYDRSPIYDQPPAIEQVSTEIPQETALLSAYPNPFTDKVNFKYELKSATTVTLRVFDVTGKEVAVLLKDTAQEAGVYQVDFSGKDWASGVYFYRLETPQQVLSKSVVLIR